MSDYDTDEWNSEDDFFQEVIQMSEVQHVRAAYREARESRTMMPPELRKARFIRFMDLDVGVRRHIGEFVGHRFFRVAFRVPVKRDEEDTSGYFLPDFNANVLVYTTPHWKRGLNRSASVPLLDDSILRTSIHSFDPRILSN